MLKVYRLLLVLLCMPMLSTAYPIDGFLYSGIARLLQVKKVVSGEIKQRPPKPGSYKSIDSIQLHLIGARGESLTAYPIINESLQTDLDRILPGLDQSYSVAVLDITPGREMRYAERQPDRGFQPGSVGKLAVLTALFYELEKLYPDCYEDRVELLRTRLVKGGPFAVHDHHTIPIYNLATDQFLKRQTQPGDVFTLFEWTDHMVSVSNNGAASIVWREALLMRVFGNRYPTLTQEEADAYFADTPRSELAEVGQDVVNAPLQDLGISREEWRLGQMFTRGASNIVPGKGGSIGTPKGLMKFLIALESGHIVDEQSSLEMKRLLYMTDRRIRYGASSALDSAAVYFKSGSFYSCSPKGSCGKYKGNVFNYMNSVAIIEQPDGTVYLVVLMTNVLRRNSQADHYALAGRIDRMIRKVDESDKDAKEAAEAERVTSE